VLAKPGVLVLYTSRLMSQLSRMMLVPIAPLFLRTLLADHDHLNTFTGLVTGISAATTAVSSVYLGQLGDRIGHRCILVTSLVMAGLLYLPRTFVPSGPQFLALQALLGVAFGGILPIISSLLAS